MVDDLLEKYFSSHEELADYIERFDLQENITYYSPLLGWVLVIDEDFDEDDEDPQQPC